MVTGMESTESRQLICARCLNNPFLQLDMSEEKELQDSEEPQVPGGYGCGEASLLIKDILWICIHHKNDSRPNSESETHYGLLCHSHSHRAFMIPS
jgi:hypothetical protein